MPNVFVTSDEHHCHGPVNDLSGRPFGSPEEATEEIIRRHNKVVDDDATVFHLGDYGLSNRALFLSTVARLRGAKHVLVSGNHDRCWGGARNGFDHVGEYLAAGFHAVVDSARLALPPVKGRAPARQVLLSHFPYEGDHVSPPRHMQHRLRDEGMWLLHGHVHGLYTVRDRGVNVGVDVWNFTPVNVHTIARLIADVEEGVVAEF